MSERESSEVDLSMSERLAFMKAELRKVIKIASNDDLDDGSKKIQIDRALEDFMLHAEAAGSSLDLNARERTVVGTITQRVGANPELVAQRCAQLLGALNHDARYPVRWEDQPNTVKVVFFHELDEVLEKILEGTGNLDDLCYLEELISGFICHESYHFDPEIQKLCFDIEECIREAFRPNGRIDFIRLRIKRVVLNAMQEKLKEKAN